LKNRNVDSDSILTEFVGGPLRKPKVGERVMVADQKNPLKGQCGEVTAINGLRLTVKLDNGQIIHPVSKQLICL